MPVTSKKGIKGSISQFGNSVIMNCIKKATCSKLGIIQERNVFQKTQIEVYNLEYQTPLLAFKIHKMGLYFLIIESHWGIMGKKELTSSSSF